MHALNTEDHPIIVLLIEDNPGDARLIRDLLKGVQAGRFQYMQAGTLSKGMELLHNDNIDIVLLDLGLPDSQGLDTLLKVTTEFEHIPVVIMTGLDDEKTAVGAMNMGAQDYLIKGQADGNMLSRVLRYSIERKRADLLLTESEAKYRSLVENSNEGICIIQDGLLKFVNRSLGMIAEASADEMLNKPFLDYVHPDDRDLLIERESQRIQGKQFKTSYIFRGMDKDEKTLWLNLNTALINWEGKPATLNFLVDITERKLSEEKLAKSYDSLKKTLNDAINTMAKIVEMRDPYTSGHQQKVANLATAIAREMNLEETRIDQLRMAAIIHDIGKIYIPSDILSKPGRLSDIEFNLIKTHAQSGYDIVKGMDFPGVIADTILQHHERLDGSGYPRGLIYSQMLTEAKILAVADVVEAMASHRPYRAALGLEKALAEIEQNSGKLYYPDVVDACLGLFREKAFSFES